MKEKILLRKTYSIYASDIHLATMIFPFVDKEIERGAIIKPILEKDISNSIEKIIENIGLKYEMKNRIAKIDWSQTNIDKIKETLEQMEEELLQKQVIHIIVSGTNLFIDKVNKLLDLWAKINLENIQRNNSTINIINCYNFNENEEIENIERKHEYQLKTTGIEEIYQKEILKKAN